MSYSIRALLISIFLATLFSCKKAEEKVTDSLIYFDSVKAQKLCADEYGMKPYVIAFLKSGPNQTLDSIEADKLQLAHLQNIMRLAEEGKLVMAGPFLDNSEIRGIYIFNVETIEEAAELTSTDPAIQQGRLVMELHPWYGSAALQEINAIHKTIQLQSILEN